MSNAAITLQKIIRHLGSVDVSCLDDAELRRATAEARGAEQALAVVKLRIGQRANQLAAAGTGADAGAVLLGVGDVSAGTARKEAA